MIDDTKILNSSVMQYVIFNEFCSKKSLSVVLDFKYFLIKNNYCLSIKKKNYFNKSIVRGEKIEYPSKQSNLRHPSKLSTTRNTYSYINVVKFVSG